MGDFGSKDNRQVHDYYPSPTWTVTRLLEKLDLPGGVWLEPCAGNGNVIKAVNAWNKQRPTPLDISWKAVELQEQFKPKLDGLVGPENVSIDDFLVSMPIMPDVVITNPPYGLVNEFVTASLMQAKSHVAMLLKLNYAVSEKRSSFLRRNMPDMYILPQRPYFGPGVSDSTEYVWYVWDKRNLSGTGKIIMLNDTNPTEKKASEKSLFD